MKPPYRRDAVLTYWIRFKNFTAFAEGKTLEEALGSLGMTTGDMEEWSMECDAPEKRESKP